MAEYYRKNTKEVLDQLKVVQSKGLSSSEVSRRLNKYGSNILKVAKKINPLKLFLEQFYDVLIIILILAAAVSYGLSLVEHNGDATESILIFIIVLAIAFIGFLNEYKAEKTIEALTKLAGSTTRVCRDSTEQIVDVADIVPGDIVLLKEGDKVPADIRLLKVNNLSVNEASLTGESLPVAKNTFTLGNKTALADRKNMLFSGTIVSSGNCEGVVVATGEKSEIGHIADLINAVSTEATPMQRKLNDLGRKIGAIVLAVSLLVFVAIFLFDKDLESREMLQKLIFAFTTAVALAVAAIPEGLAFVVRISLALGARRMAEKNALIRRLSAVETLGSTDVICTDKTGTLTKGEMMVRKLYIPNKTYSVDGSGYGGKGKFTLGKKDIDPKELFLLLKIGVINNNAHIDAHGRIIGDPTEGALLVSALKAGMDDIELKREFHRLREVTFSSQRKMMTTVHRHGRKYLIASKGATSALLRKCDRVYLSGKVVKLTPKLKKQILAEDSRMASSALRVLAFAYREVKEIPQSDKEIESKLIFVGLQGMMDPPRPEVAQVMHRVTAEAGMRVLMITGDHVLTAEAVAKEVGIEGEAITGDELDQLTQEELEKRVEKIAVYARVNPEHKIRIIEALKQRGHQVAMTGDGVNDAPAIKAADIGIAMGITGTDAAKETADLILLDDQFLTIISAIEEGRGIFDNVRKFVNYLLSANIAEVATVFGGILAFGQLVLGAVQLLFINVVTDGLPAVALGSEKVEKGVMLRKPREFQSSIINRRVWIEMFTFGLLMSFAILAHYQWIESSTGDTARALSVAFAATIVYELVRLVNIRMNHGNKWFSNPWLSVAMLSSIGLMLAVLYIPWLASLFSVIQLHVTDWILIAAGSVLLIFGMKLAGRVIDTYTQP